jgi:hypothetical protein
MYFKEAYQKMLEGKKVKRKGWEGWQYYKLIGDNMYYADKLIASNITVENALADDWEIVGEREVVEEPKWKPREGELYFYVNSNGEMEYRYYKNRNINDKRRICNIGNYFKTDEEAEHMVEKLKVIKELKELSNIKFNMSDYLKNNKIYYIAYDFTQNRIVPLFDNISRNIPFNVYFSTKEDCEKAITKIGKERLERYYFDMED